MVNINSKIIKKINESNYDESIKEFLKEIFILEYNIKDQKYFSPVDKKHYDREIRRYANKYGDSL